MIEVIGFVFIVMNLLFGKKKKKEVILIFFNMLVVKGEWC